MEYKVENTTIKELDTKVLEAAALRFSQLQDSPILNMEPIVRNDILDRFVVNLVNGESVEYPIYQLADSDPDTNDTYYVVIRIPSIAKTAKDLNFQPSPEMLKHYTNYHDAFALSEKLNEGILNKLTGPVYSVVCINLEV